MGPEDVGLSVSGVDAWLQIRFPMIARIEIVALLLLLEIVVLLLCWTHTHTNRLVLVAGT